MEIEFNKRKGGLLRPLVNFLFMAALFVFMPIEAGAQKKSLVFKVNGVSFTMIRVEGGDFDMGLPREQKEEKDPYGIVWSKNEYVHNVKLGSYYLGETEVTSSLWAAVMGEDSKLNLPVSSVSWEECQVFLRELNKQTGKTFRLPTEAEWEYAARGGGKSKGFDYAGSDKIDAVAWYEGNSEGKAHPVKKKKANELGLYDMCGNVGEWCNDKTAAYSGDSYYSVSPWVNPEGYDDYYMYDLSIYKTDSRVVRGGSFSASDKICSVTARQKEYPDRKDESIGFRIALTDDTNPMDNLRTTGLDIEVNREIFRMVFVDGGSFTMGYNEQDAIKDPDGLDPELTPHQVKVSSFYIGETEVTKGLWNAVMDIKGDFFGKNDPAVGVSWDSCQEFIKRLNLLSGRVFRMPTEAEWEYAARGGKKSKGYLYSGSDNAIDAGWTWENMLGAVQPVALKKPNELGLYDMTGNVAEWCSDWYDEEYYGQSSAENPQGPETGDYKVCRGGLWNDDARPNYYRMYESPSLSDERIGYSPEYNGLRLVMEVSNP